MILETVSACSEHEQNLSLDDKFGEVLPSLDAKSEEVPLSTPLSNKSEVVQTSLVNKSEDVLPSLGEKSEDRPSMDDKSASHLREGVNPASGTVPKTPLSNINHFGKQENDNRTPKLPKNTKLPSKGKEIPDRKVNKKSIIIRKTNRSSP